MHTKCPRCDEPGDAEVLGLLPAIPVQGEGLKALDGHSQDGEEAGKLDQTSNLCSYQGRSLAIAITLW